MAYFDEQEWDKLAQDPLWYAGQLGREAQELIEYADEDKEHRSDIKKVVRAYFTDRLERGMIALAETGENEDAERKLVDTVVIHHTSGTASNYTLPYLNATQLLRIYVPAYLADGRHHKKPLWSGHFYNGKQVFWGYHWFIFPDGRAERILPDSAIGWHAGNWEVNTRSVGICFAGNFMEQPPNPAMLQACQQIITEHYNDPVMRLIGHKEAPRDTTCPGDTFDSWRLQLQPKA
jgi:hypothetical protein